MKYLGIDYGTKRVGIAVGDSESKIAMPLTTLVSNETFWDALARLLKDEEIDEVVIGMPVTLRKGTREGETVRGVEWFMNELAQRFSLPTHEEDERFSTDMAGRFTGGAKKDRDAIAAAIILQSYLDKN